MKICLTCGKEILPCKRYCEKIYCSRACKLRAWRAKKKEKIKLALKLAREGRY